MIPMRPPLCVYCKRFNRDSFDPPTCASFPNGIPDLYFDAVCGHITSDNGELPFEGTIPVTWTLLAPGVEGPDDDTEKGGPRGVTKGDFEGHPFRGNQWTQGEGGGEDTAPGKALSEDDKVELSLEAVRIRNKVEDAVRAGVTGDARDLEQARVALQGMRNTIHDNLKKAGVSVMYSTQGEPNIVKDAQATVGLAEVGRAISNLPEGVRAQIEANGGLHIEVTDKVTRFTANGVEFTRGGSARWDGVDGKPTIELCVRDRGAFDMLVNVLDHEMGHIVVDAIGAPGTMGDVALSDAKTVHARSRMGVMESVRDTISEFARNNFDGKVGDALPDHPKADSRWGSYTAPIREWLDRERAKISAALSERASSLMGFEQAIAAEGGVTDYAETWNQDPDYGHRGSVRDPVHRGAHESFAELEQGYSTMTKRVRLTPQEYANMIADGVDAPVRGWISKPRPKTAEAWLRLRKHADEKMIGRGKLRVPKDIKERLETLTRMNDKVGVQGFERWKSRLAKLIEGKAP